MGIASNAVKKAFGVYDSQPDTERGNKVVKARLAPGWVQQPVSANFNTDFVREKKCDGITDLHMSLTFTHQIPS